MDAFAFPSLFRGFGIVAIKALAARLLDVYSEDVPEEVYIDPRITVVPLSKGSTFWAAALMEKSMSFLPQQCGWGEQRYTLG